MFTSLILLSILSYCVGQPVTVQKPFPSNTAVNEFPLAEGPEIFPESRPHHLFVGRCGKNDELLHAETIIINNDGTSRTAGDIRINVDGPVFITCVRVTDQLGADAISGAYPSYLAGGVGHNYIILGFRTAYGYGANFYVEIHGVSIESLRNTGAGGALA